MSTWATRSSGGLSADGQAWGWRVSIIFGRGVLRTLRSSKAHVARPFQWLPVVVRHGRSRRSPLVANIGPIYGRVAGSWMHAWAGGGDVLAQRRGGIGDRRCRRCAALPSDDRVSVADCGSPPSRDAVITAVRSRSSGGQREPGTCAAVRANERPGVGRVHSAQHLPGSTRLPARCPPVLSEGIRAMPALKAGVVCDVKRWEQSQEGVIAVQQRRSRVRVLTLSNLATGNRFLAAPAVWSSDWHIPALAAASSTRSVRCRSPRPRTPIG